VGARPTIGVLTPWIGGPYFGSIFKGIARAAATAGARVIVSQTVDIDTLDYNPPFFPDYHHEISWDRVDGCIVLLNAVDPDYLRALREAGKPLVFVSSDTALDDCPVVLPDNYGGVRRAVRHLVDHGHHRIAFAGNLRERDIRERHTAYLDELRGCGIEPDPDLMFDTGGNVIDGGHRAAQAMLDAGLPSTAVMAGTDLNAVGLIQSLVAAGHRIPRSQAVVGFDDCPWAVFQRPGLSTVRQPTDGIGVRAAELVMALLAGEEVPTGPVHLPTPFVARQSCGCPAASTAPGPEDPARPWSRERFVAELGEVFDLERLGRGAHLAAVPRMAEVIAEAVEATALGLPPVDLTDLQDWLVAVNRGRNRPEYVWETVRCARAYGMRLVAGDDRADALPPGTDPAAGGRPAVETFVQDLALRLAEARSEAQYLDTQLIEEELWTGFRVNLDLLHSHENDPKTLGWLRDSRVAVGCLALWSADGHGQVLDVVGTYHRDGRESAPRRRISARKFPPEEVLAALDAEPGSLVFTATLKQATVDRGLLALVMPPSTWAPTGWDTLRHWTVLLATALDYEEVVESLQRSEDLLRHAAHYDALTGLPNRSLFLDRLDQAILRAERHPERTFAVLFLDLDGFKHVNDSLGHGAGDDLLRQVANRISSSLRASDTAARFGGDEFALLASDLDGPDDHLGIAERLRRVLNRPFTVEGQQVTVGASVGIALGRAGNTPEEILRDADTAMYRAKSRDRRSSGGPDPDLNDPDLINPGGPAPHTNDPDRPCPEINPVDPAGAARRPRPGDALRRALDAGELAIHHRPLVLLDSGEPVGVEALVRWRHPDRGLVPATELLPSVEESGLVRELDGWVLGEACRQVRGWQRGATGPALRVHVPVSCRLLRPEPLVRSVTDCLGSTGLDPACLVLEFAEDVVSHDVEVADRVLAAVTGLGVGIVLAGFGAGRSSPAALHRLPVRGLKLHPSIVSGATDPAGGDLARAVTALGSCLRRELIADGVETREQRRRLLDLGCTLGLGGLFSGPLPAAEAEAYLRSAATSGV